METQQHASVGQQAATTSAIVHRLVRYSGPPEQFLGTLLTAQCQLAQAAAGAIIRLTQAPAEPEPAPSSPNTPDESDDAAPPPTVPAKPKVNAQVMAVHPAAPEGSQPPAWLAYAVELTLKNKQGLQSHVHRLPLGDPAPGQPAAHHLVIVPIQTDHGFTGVEVFLLDSDDPITVQARRQRIELSVSLLSLYEMRQVLLKRDADLQGVSTATRVLAASNDHERFGAAAIAFCNEVQSRWGAERVSLGLLSGRYVKLKAMSQTEHISRKMAMVSAIEAAMEECIDQDVEVPCPAPPEATLVNRAAMELSTKHGPSSLLSLPLRRNGEALGAVTVERSADRPITLEEVQYLRMACDLCTSRLLDMAAHDRWIGARAADEARGSLSWLLGAKHTWAKVTAVLLLAGGVALCVVPGTIRVEAPFMFQAVLQRSIPAPFDGYLDEVLVEPDDVVEAGQVLAKLDTAELRAEMHRLEAERQARLTEANMARREGEQAERQIAESRVMTVDAQLDWLRWQIDHASMKTPIAGSVVVGELKQKLGAPLEKGDVLFEVAPLSELRAEVLVPDDRIADVPPVGATGRLAAAAHPADKLAFEVEHINPIAEVIDGNNVFRVRVKLLDERSWTRPGIEGVAKIDARRAPLGWVWTRDAVNWVRMKLWW